MAGAIGVGIDVHAPIGSMIIDIGGGTSEIAVIALSGIVNGATSIRIGGDKFDDAIVQYLKKNYNLLVGERTAEQIKKEIGSACPLEEEMETQIKGRDPRGSHPENDFHQFGGNPRGHIRAAKTPSQTRSCSRSNAHRPRSPRTSSTVE